MRRSWLLMTAVVLFSQAPLVSADYVIAPADRAGAILLATIGAGLVGRFGRRGIV